jgi:hypothetical protein
MAEQQPPLPENITPEQFFEQVLPMGFAAQAEGGAPVPADFTMAWKPTGDGGGEWFAEIREKRMSVRKGSGDAVITFTISTDHWRDAVLSRNGVTPAVLLPQQRPGRPDNTARVKTVKGTVAQELARDGMDAFKVEMTFNGAAAPRAIVKMKLPDFLAMQEGKLNGQEAFMTGRLRIEGDMAFMMQVAALTA